MGELNILHLSSRKLPDSQVDITLPSSKSISNRLLILSALSGNEITIENLSDADDTVLLHRALTAKGGEINLGHAGTALRFATAWAAITPGERILTGSERLCNRPLKPLIESLRLCGADIVCLEKEGYAPLRIRGKKLSGGIIQIDGSESSQFLSAQLMVAPYFDGSSDFFPDPGQVSIPYMEMTLALMKQAGAGIVRNEKSIRVKPGSYSKTAFHVESDWSAASYFYALALFIPGVSILLGGLRAKSVQGDRAVSDIFSRFGIRSTFTDEAVLIENTGEANPPKKLNLIANPDLAQTIAVAACGLKLPIRLTGLQTLRLKETDRLTALSAELRKCGADCHFGTDFLEITSVKNPEKTPRIQTYQDHRMAMAFAPLAAVFGKISIEDPEVVSKSFPDFWSQVEKLGFQYSPKR